MTIEQAKELLKKAQNNEPLTQDERSKLRQAYEIVLKSAIVRPVS